MKDKRNITTGELVLSGTLWVGAWRWSARLIGFASTIVLARLLLPDDFGIVATALIVIAFFDILIDLGTDKYLIRLEDPDDDDYNTAWTLRLTVISLASIAVFFCAQLAANFFGDQRLIMVLQVLAFANVLRGLTNIGLTKYRRNLQYGKIALIGIGQRLTGTVTAIVLAYIYQSYWAMVFGEVALRLFEVFSSYLIHPYRPQFCVKKIVKQWAFSKWIIIRNLASFIHGQGDQLVVAKYFGLQQIGFYSMSIRFASMPTLQLIAPMKSPVYSGLAKSYGDDKRFTGNVLKLIGAMLTVVLPAAVMVVLLREPLVAFVLGEKWVPVIPLLTPLVFTLVASVLLEPAVTTLTLMGRVKLLAVLHWLSAIIMISVLLMVAQFRSLDEFLIAVQNINFESFLLAARNGTLLSFVYARVVLASSFVFIYYIWLLHALSISWLSLINATYRPVLACLGMWVAVDYLYSVLPSVWWSLVILGMVGGLVYVILVYLFWFVASSPDSGDALLIKKFYKLFGRLSNKVRI